MVDGEKDVMVVADGGWQLQFHLIVEDGRLAVIGDAEVGLVGKFRTAGLAENVRQAVLVPFAGQ